MRAVIVVRMKKNDKIGRLMMERDDDGRRTPLRLRMRVLS